MLGVIDVCGDTLRIDIDDVCSKDVPWGDVANRYVLARRGIGQLSGREKRNRSNCGDQKCTFHLFGILRLALSLNQRLGEEPPKAKTSVIIALFLPTCQ